MNLVFEQSRGLTDAMIAEMRSYIGQPLRIEQYNHEASYDTIRHYALGIGDDNPLWCDEDYAAKARYGTMVAPPTFLYSIFAPGIAPGLSGLQPFQAGCSCTWYRLPRRGDRIKADARLVGFDEFKGKHAGRMIIQHGEVRYVTSAGDELALFKSDCYRVMRAENRDTGGLSYKPEGQYRYSLQELRAIERDIRAEEVRGATPRYWEDVTVGDLLVPVVKGPLDRITMTVYYAGAMATSGYKGCEVKWKQWIDANEDPSRVPNNYDISYYSERVLASLGHQDDKVAQAIGMPAAYDNGHQRTGWMAHVVTNWMGDAGFLSNLNVRIRRPNIFGNTTWVRGQVVDKTAVNGQPAVQIELWAEDQRGTKNTTGSAVVHLPSRKQG